jgi:hypothetical protein
MRLAGGRSFTAASQSGPSPNALEWATRGRDGSHVDIWVADVDAAAAQITAIGGHLNIAARLGSDAGPVRQ